VLVLISVSFGSPDPEAARLLMEVTTALDQLKLVEGVPDNVLKLKTLPLQIAEVVVLVKVGVGLTITLTIC